MDWGKRENQDGENGLKNRGRWAFKTLLFVTLLVKYFIVNYLTVTTQF